MLTFWPAAGVCASAILEAARRDRRSPPRHTSARNPRVEPSRCLTPLLLFVDRGWRDSPRGILHQPLGGPLGTAAEAARAPCYWRVTSLRTPTSETGQLTDRVERDPETDAV